MAIVKMKHLRLVAMTEDREELFQLLQRMGCVEIDEPAADPDDPVLSSLTRSGSSLLNQVKEEQTGAEHALTVLKKWAPEKGGLLKPRPGLSEAELFDEGQTERARLGAKEVNEAERRLVSIQNETVKLQTQKANLAPWLKLDLPLDAQSTQTVTVQLGTLPAQADLAAVQQQVLAVGELTELTEISAGRDFKYCLLVSHKSQSEAVLEVLKEQGWSRANLREWTGTAAENDARIDRELEALAQEKTGLEQKLSGMGGLRPELRKLSDRAAVEVSREESKTRLLDTKKTFLLEGWVPAENWEKLQQALEPYPCACEADDPEKEDYPTVPVKLKNNWFTRPLNMVTEMYSLPAYGSLDPNPLMAPFFVLFYGIMMADMGYGLVMMLVSLFIMKRMKPKGPSVKYMIPLLGLCGVSTFIVGAMTGGFFGDMIPQVAMMLNPDTSLTELPHLFTPLDDALSILIGSCALGFAQILTGMAVSFYRQFRDGEKMAALCNEGAWFAVFVCIGAGAALGYAKYGVIAALVILVLTQGYGKKGIMGKLMGIGGSLYNNITGYFSDILSYSRLMALMLAGSVVAMVFNTLGAITGNVVLFIIISMIGNTLNFALNLLGCFVHDMRLQCLEYFGRFYQDGGKPFNPLCITTKYVDIINK